MAFLYKNFVFSNLREALGNLASHTTVGVAQNKRDDFEALLGEDGDREAILVIKEEVEGAATKVEVVKMTSIAGNDLTVERGQEGTTPQAFTTAARISNTITAERASILGGIANTDLEPEGDRSVGLADKPFMDVHARNLKIRHGEDGMGNPLEFTIKPQSEEAISANQDLLLPPGGGTLMRTEDTTEEHPGCFLGELCVEPDSEARLLSARDTEYGHGIHIVSYDDTTIKVAMHNSEGSEDTLAGVLGLTLVTGGNADDPTYQRTGITLGGVNYEFTNVRIDTVGDFYTVEGTRSSAFTVALFTEWLGTLEFDRKADSVLVAKHVYADRISAESVVIGSSRSLRIPVVDEAPGKDQDETDGFAVGSIVFSSDRDMSYVCIDATEGAARWRPFSPPPIGTLTSIPQLVIRQDPAQFAAQIISLGFSSAPSSVWQLNRPLTEYKRLYVYDGNLGEREYPSVILDGHRYGFDQVTPSGTNPSFPGQGFIRLPNVVRRLWYYQEDYVGRSNTASVNLADFFVEETE